LSRRSTQWIDGFWIAAAAGMLYLFLGQQTLYRVDAHALLWRSMVGQTSHQYHTFYLPVLEVFKSLCSPLKLSLYEVAQFYSVVGTSAGLFLAHLANLRIGLSRVESAFATGLLAVCPAVLFFATIVEVHGPLFFFIGLTYLAVAEVLRVPKPSRAVWLGACLSLGFLAHPVSALMGALLPVLWVWRVSSHDARPAGYALRSLFSLGALAAVILLLGILALPWALRELGFTTDAKFSFDYLVAMSDQLFAPLQFLATVRDEWLLAFLPLSITTAALLFFRRWRRTVLVYGLALVPYMLTCHLMLVEYGELGAYVIPMAWPMAVLLAPLSIRMPWLALASLALSLLLSIAQVSEHDRPEPAREHAAGMQAIAQGKELYAFLGSKADTEAYFVHLPNLPIVWIPDLLTRGPEVREQILQGFERELAKIPPDGRVVLISKEAKGTLDTLVGSFPSRSASILGEYLESRFRFEPVRNRGFDGYRLLPR
jgi:hypothetical protein